MGWGGQRRARTAACPSGTGEARRGAHVVGVKARFAHAACGAGEWGGGPALFESPGDGGVEGQGASCVSAGAAWRDLEFVLGLGAAGGFLAVPAFDG